MTPFNDDIPVGPSVSRRTVATAAAWAAPVVAAAAAAPLAAASSDVRLRILSATLVDDAERPVTIVPASGVIGVPLVDFELTTPGAGDDRVRIDVAPVRSGDVTAASGNFPISWISATSPSSPGDGGIVRGALATGDVLELRVSVTSLRDPAVTASALITVPTATAVIWGSLDGERRPYAGAAPIDFAAAQFLSLTLAADGTVNVADVFLVDPVSSGFTDSGTLPRPLIGAPTGVALSGGANCVWILDDSGVVTIYLFDDTSDRSAGDTFVLAGLPPIAQIDAATGWLLTRAGELWAAEIGTDGPSGVVSSLGVSGVAAIQPHCYLTTGGEVWHIGHVGLPYHYISDDFGSTAVLDNDADQYVPRRTGITGATAIAASFAVGFENLAVDLNFPVIWALLEDGSIVRWQGGSVDPYPDARAHGFEGFASIGGGKQGFVALGTNGRVWEHGADLDRRDTGGMAVYPTGDRGPARAVFSGGPWGKRLAVL